MSSEATAICARCGRTVRTSMCRALEPLKGRKRYACRGLMARSCQRLADDKGEPDPVAKDSTVEK